MDYCTTVCCFNTDADIKVDVLVHISFKELGILADIKVDVLVHISFKELGIGAIESLLKYGLMLY